MGPFLHAHTGKAQLTGFHKHGLSTQESGAIFEASVPSFSAVTDSDSPAWEVPASKPQTTDHASWEDVRTLAFLGMLALAFFANRIDVPILQRRFAAALKAPRIYKLRVSPPSHAPPRTFA
jgi:hypothetical protein